MTVAAGQFEIIKDSIGQLTPDPRLQGILIAFAFGGFLAEVTVSRGSQGAA